MSNKHCTCCNVVLGMCVTVVLCVVRVQVRDREIKVNIFDMAGHPFFYEVSNWPQVQFISILCILLIQLHHIKLISNRFSTSVQTKPPSMKNSVSEIKSFNSNGVRGHKFWWVVRWETCLQVMLLNQLLSSFPPPVFLFPPLILFVFLFFPLRSVSQVRNEFYKDSQGVLLVYDVGLRESFDALDSWLGEMKQEMGSQANMDSIVFVVCANKVELISSAPRL